MDHVTLGSGTFQDISDVLAFTKFKMCIFFRERAAAAVLAAAALAQPIKEWATPWRAPLLYPPPMAPVALAVDAAIDTATGGQL